MDLKLKKILLLIGNQLFLDRTETKFRVNLDDKTYVFLFSLIKNSIKWYA